MESLDGLSDPGTGLLRVLPELLEGRQELGVEGLVDRSRREAPPIAEQLVELDEAVEDSLEPLAGLPQPRQDLWVGPAHLDLLDAVVEPFG